MLRQRPGSCDQRPDAAIAVSPDGDGLCDDRRMPLPLVTDRLIVRAPRPEDLDPLRELFGDAEAMRYVGSGKPWDESRMAESLDRKIEQLPARGFTLYTVERRSDGRVLGDCGLNVWPDTGETEIGWRFAREHWGRGYATEAAQAVFEHARSDVGLAHLICMVHDDNTPSRRIAERLGFRLDHVEQRDGRPVRRYVWTR